MTHHRREAKITSPVISLGDDGYRFIPVAAIVGIVAIAAAFALAVLSNGLGDGLRRFSFAYLTNFSFFTTISLGGLFFVFIHHLARAGWSVTVRRIAEILAVGLIPLFFLSLPIVLPVVFGYSGLYVWNQTGWTARYTGHVMETVEANKGSFLSAGFFGVRTVLYFAIWTIMAWFFFSHSIRQDETGDSRLTSKMQKFAAPMIIVFAATLVFSSFDWEMSLEPMWFSTMFPVYFFAGCVLGGFSMMALIALLLQRSGRVTDEITVDNIHDLGKFMFAFVVFWGYIAYSQFMLIWYANVPEETFWYKYRFTDPGYRWLTVVLLFGHLLIPFLALMPRTFKRNRSFMLGAAIYVLAMHWLDHFWLVMPQLTFDGGNTASFVFPWIELIMLVGFAGLYSAMFCFFASNRALVPTKDPRMGEALNYTNA